MTLGRTSWRSKDNGWWRRERVVRLGHKYGPAGPAALDWLECEADQQREVGVVKAGYLAVALGCFANDPDLVREIVGYAAEIGALDDLREADDGLRFTARVSGWRSDQQRAREAEKKAAWRARKRAEASSAG